MMTRSIAVAAFILAACPAHAQDATITYKSLSPELALDLARATLSYCQKKGYQIAVVVTDRFGNPLVMLRDRFAGAHTPATAQGKAWTATSFRTSTLDLTAMTQPGSPQSGLRNLPNVVMIGGGILVEAGGTTVGGVGVSGAPGGEMDDECAKAGVSAMKDKLDF